MPTADPPRITTHPQRLKDAVPGQPVVFTIQAEGTEPLNYQWQQKPRGGSEGWQDCDMERFPGADSSTLTIPSAQKSNEGSYHCTVSNCASSETSDSASLTLGELKYYVFVIEYTWYADKDLTVESYLFIPSHKFGIQKVFAWQFVIQQA